MSDPLSSVAPQLDALVETFRQSSRSPSVAAGVVLGDRLAWSHVTGLANVEEGRPADVRTLYSVASITKPVTATAILQLRDEGRLALEDPLVRHVPEFAAARNPFGPIEQVTIRGLLTHMSGLQADPPPPFPAPALWKIIGRETMLASFDRAAVVIPPGSKHKYSNFGFELLGEVVRRVSGLSIEAYLRRHILDPLGMTSSVMTLTEELATRQGRGYWSGGWTDRAEPSVALDPELIHACGGLRSSVEDLARWISQQLRAGDDLPRGDGEVLAGRSLAEMHRQTILTTEAWDAGQGLGWSSKRRGQTILVGHAGGLDGWSTRIGFDPVARFGVIVLTNRGGTDTPPLTFDIADLVAPLARGEAARAASLTVPAPVPDAWLELVGAYCYRATIDRPVSIEVRGGRLVVLRWDPTPFHIAPTADPSVFLAEGGHHHGERMTIHRRPDGTIARLMLGSEPADRIDWVGPEVLATTAPDA